MVVSAQKEPSLHLRPVPLCMITTLTFITTYFFCLSKTAQRSRYKIYGYSKSMIRNTLFLLTSTKQNPSCFWSIYLCTAVWLVLSFIMFESINTPSVFVHYIGAREVVPDFGRWKRCCCKQVIWGLHICVLFCCVYTNGGTMVHGGEICSASLDTTKWFFKVAV